MVKTLNNFDIGEKGVVRSVSGEGKIRRRLFDMGVTPGAEVVAAQKSTSRRSHRGNSARLRADAPQDRGCVCCAGGGRMLKFALAGNPNCGKTTPVQRADRLHGARRQLAGRHGGQEGGRIQEGNGAGEHTRPSRHLFAFSVHSRRGHSAQLHTRRKTGPRHQHRGRHESGAQPLSHHTAA